MKKILQELKSRNATLYYFGMINLIAALICLVLSQVTTTEVLGINAYIKPTKFFVSGTIFAWTIAWVMSYLPSQKTVKPYSWFLVLVFTFEEVYILYKASIGRLSHFDISTPMNGMLFGLMGIVISILTLWTLYIGVLFFVRNFPSLSKPYLWGIRLGILLFVVFAFEGLLMGSMLSHTVGAVDGGEGLPITNWSKNNGDLRIAHFFGMHALQIVPFFGYYVAQKTWQTLVFAMMYLAWVSWTLWQALQGLPLF